MGASNFGRLNKTSCLHVFAIDDNDRGDEYNFIKEQVLDELDNIGVADTCYIHGNYYEPLSSVGVEIYDKEYKQRETYYINCFIELGYHDGARFDIERDCAIPIPSYKEKEVASRINKIDKIYKKYTSGRKKIATFSNGEGIYEQVK